MLIVQKFGGSSLADPEGLRRAARLAVKAREHKNQVIVVVSAMGDSTDDLTDLARQMSPAPPPRELDALLSTGELQSAALLAITLDSMGIPARSFSGWQAGIYSSSSFGSAEIDHIETEKLRPCLDAGVIAVVAGFQALAPDGSVSTLGRGGSDTSAVMLAAAFHADRCEIYSDVEGIYTADPRLVEKPRLLRQMDVGDMLKLSLCGSQVLHSRSVREAKKSRVPLKLLSSFHPAVGTQVCPLQEEERPFCAGITWDREANFLSLVGKGVDGDLLPRLHRILSAAGIRIRSVRLRKEQLSLEILPEERQAAIDLIHSALFPEP